MTSSLSLSSHSQNPSSRHSVPLSNSTSLPFFPKPGRSAPSHAAAQRIIPSGAIPRASSTPPTASHVNAKMGDSNLDQNVEIPSRSTSLRRKPVPSLLPMPTQSPVLPLSHPFARSLKSTSSANGSVESDLFYAPPPPPRTGPRPPRRNRDSLASAAALAPSSLPPSPASSAMISSVPPSPSRDPAERVVSTREGSTLKDTDQRDNSLHSLRAREAEIQRKEEEMRMREAEFLIRKREEELQEREEALRQREERLRRLQAGTTSPPPEDYSPSSPSLATPLPVPSDTLNRSLPRLPDPSPSVFRPSNESPPPRTPTTVSVAAGPSSEKRVSIIEDKVDRPRVTPRASLVPASADDENDDTFSVDRVPSKSRLWEAATQFIKDEDGKLVCFGDLFPQHPNPYDRKNGDLEEDDPPITRTVVLLIRHWFCGQCQDYTFASIALLDPVAIRKAGVRMVILSNGSWKISKAYRRVLKCPFPIYTDESRRIYRLFGMTKMTNDFGPWFSGRAAYNQRPVPTQFLHGVGNAIFRFPMADPGKLTQLGGEFILTPGYNCTFAHRMTNTSDHMEAPDVLRLAGVAHPTTSELRTVELVDSQRAELAKLEEEMRVWREQREAELDRIRRRKAERRGEIYVSGQRVAGYGLGIDEELGELDHPGMALDDSDVLGQDETDNADYGIQTGKTQQEALQSGIVNRFGIVGLGDPVRAEAQGNLEISLNARD